MKNKIEWLKRGKKRTTATGEAIAYDSRCGRYRVEAHTSGLACERGKRGQRRKRWCALLAVAGHWAFIDSRQRWTTNRNVAERMCEKHAKDQD